MQHYTLQNDEVILYRGEVTVLSAPPTQKPGRFIKDGTYLILTNLHIIIEKPVKKLFSKKVDTFLYDVQSVKKYDDVPQVIQKSVLVDVYLLGEELFLQFPNKGQASQFNNAALKLLTGFSKLVRGVKKGQKAIKETEDALDIDITGLAISAIDLATQSNNQTTNSIASFTKKFLSSKKKKEVPQIEEKTTE